MHNLKGMAPKIMLPSLIPFLILLGCISENPIGSTPNSFSSAPDTLRLNLQKVKGFGILGYSCTSLRFLDTTETDIPALIIPQDIHDWQLSYISIDNKPFFLQGYGNGRMDSLFYTNFLDMPNLIAKGKIDTANLLSDSDYYIYILRGQHNGQDVFMLDENSNKDFTDDSIRLVKPLVPKSVSNLIKCKYPIYNDTEFVIDSSWMNIGLSDQNGMSICEAFHHVTTFSIGEEQYKIGVWQYENGGLAFAWRPTLALLAADSFELDQLSVENTISRNEYLRLGNDHYHFHDITNDGRIITLIKEAHFEQQIGTQKGMIAPAFECVTVDGEVIKSNQIGKSPLLITNLTACGSGTLEDYQAILAASTGKIKVLAMEPHPKGSSPGAVVDTENDLNRKFHETYRKYYSSRICYLIGEDRRVLERFHIENWENRLAQYLSAEGEVPKD